MGQKISLTPGKDRYEDKLKREIADKNNEIARLNTKIYNPLKTSTKATTNIVNLSRDKIIEHVNNDHNFYSNNVIDKNDSGLQNSTVALDAIAYGQQVVLNNQDDEISNKNALNDALKNTPSGDYSVLFTAVKTQNNNIQNQINELHDTYSTDNQKANYQSEKILTLKRINYVLFIIYYMALLVLGLVLVMFNTTLSKQKKVIIIVLLMIFPFISDILYQLLAYIYNFIYATLNGNAYTSNNY